MPPRLRVEGGYPIWLTDRISLEPQAQLIWQHVAFDPTQDRFSSVIVRCRRCLDRADRRAAAGHLPGRHDHVAAVSEGQSLARLRRHRPNAVQQRGPAGLVRGDLARGRGGRGGDAVGECQPVRGCRLHHQPQWPAPRNHRGQSRCSDRMVARRATILGKDPRIGASQLTTVTLVYGNVTFWHIPEAREAP